MTFPTINNALLGSGIDCVADFEGRAFHETTVSTQLVSGYYVGAISITKGCGCFVIMPCNARRKITLFSPNQSRYEVEKSRTALPEFGWGLVLTTWPTARGELSWQRNRSHGHARRRSTNLSAKLDTRFQLGWFPRQRLPVNGVFSRRVLMLFYNLFDEFVWKVPNVRWNSLRY